MNKKIVLITGGTGFIGSHLLNELIQKDDVSAVYVISRNLDKSIVEQNYISILPILEKYKLSSSKKNKSYIWKHTRR